MIRTKEWFLKAIGLLFAHRALALWGVAGLSLLLLAYFSVLGTFIRPIADDYLFYGTTHGSNIGFNQYVQNFFVQNGRFVCDVLFLLFYSLPEAFLKLTPAINAMLIAGSFYIFCLFFLKRALPAFPVQRIRLASLCISLFLTAVLFFSTPVMYATLFWIGSSMVHVWPFCLLSIYICVAYAVLFEAPRKIYHVGFVALPLIIGLLGETALLTVLILQAIIALTYICKIAPPRWRALVLSFIGSIIALLCLYFAPGAIRRRNALEEASSLNLHELWDKSSFAFGYLYRNSIEPNGTLVIAGLFLLAIFIITLSYKPVTTKKIVSNKRLWFITASVAAFTPLYMLLLNLMFFKIQGDYLPPRTLYSLIFFILIALLFIAFMLSNVLIHYTYGKPHFKVLLVCTVALLFAYPVTLGRHITKDNLHFLEDFTYTITDRAEQWDARNHEILDMKARGQKHISTYSLPIGREPDITKDTSHWSNVDAALYYGVPSIKTDAPASYPAGIYRYYNGVE